MPEMFVARKDKENYEGFEVWDLARVIIQCPPPPPESEDGEVDFDSEVGARAK